MVHLISRELVAEEIVRTRVGSLGLIAAVPLTTALAAWLVLREAPRQAG
ncbi:MAG: YibE/F family protein [Anaerolineales bacterium]